MATDNCSMLLAGSHPQPLPGTLPRQLRKSRQTGASLITVIVIVLVLLIGAIAVLQSVESTSMVAGNMAFREATKQASDIAISQAVDDINSLSNPDTAVDNKYFPLRQAETGEVPNTVNWGNVAKTTVGNYDVQYVIERMCTGTLPVSSVSQCLTQVGYNTTGNGSGMNSQATSLATTDIIYRVTIKTTGPKNTEAYTQVLVGKATSGLSTTSS